MDRPDQGSEVRTRLPAGGKRIRTLGPTLTKVSAGVLPKEDPGTTCWGPGLSSGFLARWRLAARPLRGPYTARPRFRISFAPGREPELSVPLARDDTGVRNNLPPAARVPLRYQFPTRPAIVNEAAPEIAMPASKRSISRR